MHIINAIPDRVRTLGRIMTKHDHESYIVGGCVRDMILGRAPNDWDITTNAHPDTTASLFEGLGYKVVHENIFGTIQIIHEDLPIDHPERIIEITTYRSDGVYTNNRHPDTVTFSETLDEDLIRRDFTMNALAFSLKEPLDENTIIDLHGGLRDLADGVIRAVGDPMTRFSEDALRMMRAVRFASQLQFSIETATQKALQVLAGNLRTISKERIQVELHKIIMSKHPSQGMELLRVTDLMPHVLPCLLYTSPSPRDA